MNTSKQINIIKYCLIFFKVSSALSGNTNCQKSPLNEDSVALAPSASEAPLPVQRVRMDHYPNHQAKD